MAYLSNNIKDTFNLINKNNYSNNRYYNIKNIINYSKETNNNSKNYLNNNINLNHLTSSINKKNQNSILLSSHNSLNQNKITTRQFHISSTLNLNSKIFHNKKNSPSKNKKKQIKNKLNINYKIKNQDLNMNLYDNNKNVLLESIKESNCDSTTIYNNETISDDINYNELLNEYNKIENNKNNDKKEIGKKHIKHFSDVSNSLNLLKNDKIPKKENEFLKINNSCIKKNNKKYINHNKSNKINNNIKSIENNKEKNKKNINSKLLLDRNNILKDIQIYELEFVNSINNIYNNYEQNEILSEKKMEKKIFEQIINNNINKFKNKKSYNKEKSFINNFNIDYSFESDGYKKVYGLSKINNLPINDNIFKDISFRSLTNSSESFSFKGTKNEIIKNENINKKRKKVNNRKLNLKNNFIIFNDEIDMEIKKNINNYIFTDYLNYKEDIKRNISEIIIKEKKKKNKKNFIEKNICSIINNEKNKKLNTINNNINREISKLNKKKNKIYLNESENKINKTKLFNQKKICFENNGKKIKKQKLKININDNFLSKVKKKEKIKNLNSSNNQKIRNPENHINFKKKRRNINLILSNNSLNYWKYTMDKSIKNNISILIKPPKIKYKSTPKEQKNSIYSYNNANKNNKIINNQHHNKFDNSLTALSNIYLSNFHQPKKNLVNKSYQKISNKSFLQEILINKNNLNKQNIKHKNKINIFKKIEIQMYDDYIGKSTINSSKKQYNSNINKNNNSIINLKNSLYQTINKTKSNSISINNTKSLYNKYYNNVNYSSNRNQKNNSTFIKKYNKINIEINDKEHIFQ